MRLTVSSRPAVEFCTIHSGIDLLLILQYLINVQVWQRCNFYNCKGFGEWQKACPDWSKTFVLS